MSLDFQICIYFVEHMIGYQPGKIQCSRSSGSNFTEGGEKTALPYLHALKSPVLMHQSIPSTNTPRATPEIFPNFQPGSRDLYHLNFPGVPRGSNLLHNVKVPSCQLMPHEGTFQLQTDVPSLCCSLVTKSV